MDEWLPYALETVLAAYPGEIDLSYAWASQSMQQRRGSSLRACVRAGVARHSGRSSMLLPKPRLRGARDGTWMASEAAVRILMEAKIVAAFEDLPRLLQSLRGLLRLDDADGIDVSLSDFLLVHRAGFDAATVVAHAKRRWSLDELLRWIAIGFTAEQWDLAQRAGLSSDEVWNILQTKTYPDRDALVALAGLRATPALA